jgi:hypothetical protein
MAELKIIKNKKLAGAMPPTKGFFIYIGRKPVKSYDFTGFLEEKMHEVFFGSQRRWGPAEVIHHI